MPSALHIQPLRPATQLAATLDNANTPYPELLGTLEYLYSNQGLDDLIGRYLDCINEHASIQGVSYEYPLLNLNTQFGSSSEGDQFDYELVSGEEVWGKISLYIAQPFGSRQLDQIELITSLLVYPLKQNILLQSTSSCGIGHGISGVANPEMVEELTQREAKLALRNGTTMSMLLIDVDGFIPSTEELTHTQRDRVLHAILNTIRKNIRDTDQLFRYTEDEFALILGGVGGGNAYKVGERIRFAIQEETYSLPTLSKINFTVSVGIATLAKDDHIDSLFSRAENALKIIKQKGRNQVLVADNLFIR